MLALLGSASLARADLAAPPPFRDPLAGSSSLPAAPANRSPAPEVSGGSIDKEVIRRVIRRHINEVRFCYEKGLAKNPALQGNVAVKFTIGQSGAVTAAEVKQSTLNQPEVESCITNRVLRWQFPAPHGGNVSVTYPFVLRASDGGPAATQPEESAVSQPSSEPKPASAGSWFSFSAFPGGRLLCQEHVRAAGPRPMEIEWRLYATVAPLSDVVRHFERESSEKAAPDRQRGGLDLSAKADSRDKLSLFAASKRAAYPGCKAALLPGEQTLILVSRGTGG